jgi:acyl carrier protein
MSDSPWDSRLEVIVRRNCPHLDDDTPIMADDFLADLGLDSLAMVAIIVQIEETFDFIFPEHELSFQTFSTMANLWQVVSRLKPSVPECQS